MSQFQCGLMGVNIAQEPELAYTPNGRPCLKFTVLTDPPSWMKEPEKQGPTSWRVTMWGERAVFWHALFSEWTNAKSGKSGVGLNVNVLVNQVPYVGKWLHKDTGEPRASVELTAYDLTVNTQLPEGAYKRASVASRAVATTGADDWGGAAAAEAASDIPF